MNATRSILTGALTLAALAGSALAQLAPGTGEQVKRNIARFHAPYFTDADRVPSYATEKIIATTAKNPPGVIVPTFEKLPDGRHRARIDITPGTSLYGTGEVGGPLLRNGRTVTLWNTDAFGYKPDSPSLYQSHPWVLAVRPNGTAFGVLADTTWRTEINLETGIDFIAEGNPFPLFIIERDTPQDVIKGLTELIDPMPLPPKWAIGFQQCRYSYNPESRVREIAQGFRDRKIPATVLWFDIDYMAGYRAWTFDPTQFPNPRQLNEDLGKQGWKRIWMINPGQKYDPSLSEAEKSAASKISPAMLAAWQAQADVAKGVRSTGDAIDAWVKDAKGQVYQGAVWPGMCVFPDYTSPAVRTWWAGLYKPFMDQGIDGVWNDMNEPAIFNVASKTMPEDNMHVGGLEPFGKVEPGNHARFHNVYGMLMAKGTYAGIAAANPEKRPFVLTRAGYIGSQRYAATWTGDNSADWNDLEQSIPMVLNLGISGQPFSGPDIGGFNGSGPRDQAERALHFARWMGIGALLPFSRAHTAKGNVDKEPWSFGPETEAVCRMALERRYRLMPYLYTLFYEASLTNMPVARPVFFADPKDPALRGEDDAFLLGDALLVVPQLMPDGTRRPIEPKGTWRTIELVSTTPGTNATTTTNAHKDLPVLKLRGGAILPVGPIQQFTDEKPLDPLTLIVSLDAAGSAKGELYEDAGDGYGYKKGEFLTTRYVAATQGDSLVIDITGTDGQMPRPARKLIVQILTDTGSIITAEGTDGKPLTIKLK
jgi:alpha-glucosidase